MKLGQLSKMQEGERGRALGELVRAAKAKPNGQMREIDGRIRAFEIRYEMTSTEMRERFRRSELADTAEVAQWLMLVRLRERVVR
jgi:hypothetical protein